LPPLSPQIMVSMETDIPRKKESKCIYCPEPRGWGGEEGGPICIFPLTSWSWTHLPGEIIWEGNLCIFYLKACCIRRVIMQSVAIRWGLEGAGVGPFPPLLLSIHLLPTPHNNPLTPGNHPP
jgi:hypothetical protein